jgi:protein-disulfide isomerase
MKTLSLLTLTVALLGAACNKDRAPAGGGAAATSTSDLNPDLVVATVGGEKITARQLDEKLQGELASLEEQKHQMRKRGLDALINEKVLAAQAKKKGLSEDDFIKQEVEDKVPAPTEEQIKKVFDDNVSRMPPGSTVESMREQIIRFLTDGPRRQKYQELITTLRNEADVKISLPTPPKPRRNVEAKGPSRGPADARVTIVEFSDFECPFCSRAHGTVEEVMRTYAGKVKLVFRQLPLNMHPNAFKAAEASLCAHEQGRFWEYHDVLFKNREKLQVADLKQHATQLGIDTGKFNECLDSGKMASTVREDMKAAEAAGVNGTPAFFINGVFLNGAVPIQDFKEVIDAELAGS